MFRRLSEPLPLSEASMLALRPALNAPVLNVGFLPVGPARAAIVVFAEEWGFFGSIFLLLLYAFLVLWSIRIAALARDRFGAVMAVGCGGIIFWHTIFNLGMASGMLPVVGITLPLFSYGGSSVTTVLLCIALLMNVSMRRYAGFSSLERL